MGARSASIFSIAIGILIGIGAITLLGCFIRARKRNAGEGSFIRMVDDFEKKYGGPNKSKDGKSKDNSNRTRIG
jgi:hypothetical protein